MIQIFGIIGRKEQERISPALITYVRFLIYDSKFSRNSLFVGGL